jgi:adenylate kinase
MNILLIGPQGSGKGTQAEILVKEFGFYYFEMGAFLRELAKTNPLIYEYQNKKGQLVPDDVFFFAMKGLLSDKAKEGNNFLLDGFPRTISQYDTLKNWFDELAIGIDKAIFINIPEEITIKRLSSRRTCKKCGKIWNLETSPIPPTPDRCDCGGELTQRDDDKPEKIILRLNEYRKNTEPLLDLFRKEGILVEVDGNRPIDAIAKDLKEIVKEAMKNDQNKDS